MDGAGLAVARRVWNALTEPSARIEDLGDRRRAQFLAGLLAVVLPLAYLGLVQRIVGDLFTTRDVVLSSLGLLLVSVSYVLSRTRWVRVAAWVCIGSAASASYAVLLSSEIGAVQIAFMGMAVMLAGILLPLRDTIALSVLEVVAVGLLPVVAPDRVIDHQAAISSVVFFGVCVVLGVRHRDRLEQDRKAELVRSEERHRLHLEAAFEGLAVLRNDRLHEVNEGMGKILGVPAAALEGSRLADQLDPDAYDAVLGALQSEAPGPVQVVTKTPDGRTVCMELAARRAPASAKDERYLAVRDVTTRREMERKLAITENVAALGTLAAGIGHEISNPLQFVVSNLHVLSQILAPVLASASPEQRKEVEVCIQDAREGVERIAAIINDVRTLSGWARSGDDAVGDLRVAIDTAQRIAGHELRKARAHLRLELVDLPPVRASTAQLGQVFLNLIVNACHAMDDRCESRIIEVAAHQITDTRVVAEVRDNGVGIAATDIARVFEPFFTTKSPTDGTGLGLAVVQSIVTGIGGDIHVDSKPGHGTTVRLELTVA